MSPFDRLTGQRGGLLIVDMQEKLLAAIPDRDLVIANAVRLIRGARSLGIPVWATEQYPKGLGPTVAEIAELIPDRPAKTTFSCASTLGLRELIVASRVEHMTLAGIEAHVCVAQTVLDLLAMGLRVQTPADAVASRNVVDWTFALRRLERAGAVISTTEAVLFEWTDSSDHPQFKAISALVKGFTAPARAEASTTTAAIGR